MHTEGELCKYQNISARLCARVSVLCLCVSCMCVCIACVRACVRACVCASGRMRVFVCVKEFFLSVYANLYMCVCMCTFGRVRMRMRVFICSYVVYAFAGKRSASGWECGARGDCRSATVARGLSGETQKF